MRGTLLLTILMLRSSYLRNVELPLEDEAQVPDTLQWWIGPTQSWRIRTFALDHDIHTHDSQTRPDNIELLEVNTRKHFGDVLKSQHRIDLIDWADAKQIGDAFSNLGLASRVEIAQDRFAFWKPDDASYRTQSHPARN